MSLRLKEPLIRVECDGSAVAAIAPCKQIRVLNMHSRDVAVRGTSSLHSWPRGWHASRARHSQLFLKDCISLARLALRIVMDSTLLLAISNFQAGLLPCSEQRRLRPRRILAFSSFRPFWTSRCDCQEQLKHFVELLESPADFSGFGLCLESRSRLSTTATSISTAFRSSATYGCSC